MRKLGQKTNIVLACLACLALTACKTGYNRPFKSTSSAQVADCTQNPANPNANATTKAIFDNLVELSCDSADTDGVIMGQSAGNGNNIVNTTDSNRSYRALFDDLNKEPTDDPDNKGVGDMAALVSIDYEADDLFTDAQIADAHAKLKDHWDAGGLVSISWTPVNPWLEDSTDLTTSVNADTFKHSESVDLNALLLTANDSAVKIAWRNRLVKIADYLEDLEDDGITVLWRPFPRMNHSDYWYGTQASVKEGEDNADDASLFTALWVDMYTYFTTTRNLNNLLWVYSPLQADTLVKELDWSFPRNGDATDAYVDIVAPEYLHDSLIVEDDPYERMVDLGRPLGLARFGPNDLANGGNLVDGNIDNVAYSVTLKNRLTGISYWVSWHNYVSSAKVNKFAVISNKKAQELVDDEYVITMSRIGSLNFRQTSSSEAN